MNISPIGFTVLHTNRITQNKRINDNQYRLPLQTCDSVSFTGVGHGGAKLKKLAAYGVPDMYTGRMMLDSKIFEQWQKSNLFSKPIKKVLQITKHYKKTLGPVEAQVYSILRKESKKTPYDTLETIIKRLKPQYEKELLSKQQPIFEELIQTACKMPKDRFNEFMKLMEVTSRKIENDPVILPFSEREFRYKLARSSREIESRNDRNEIAAINKLKRMASYLFPSEKPTSHFVIKNSKLQKYVRNQKSASAIKRNASNLNQMYKYLQSSPLKENKELVELFDDARARIYGFPTVVPFQRKPFIHDLEKITNTLEDKKLARKMQQIAVRLPRAKDDVSAFIVKVSANTNNKIGFDLFSESVCSVDHLKPEKGGGKSILGNFGLCSKGTNSEKSNMSFATWVDKNPQARVNIQKYLNRMIELYKNGVFKHLGLKRSYITDFASTVEALTKGSKTPLVLDLRRLNGSEFFGS